MFFEGQWQLSVEFGGENVWKELVEIHYVCWSGAAPRSIELFETSRV